MGDKGPHLQYRFELPVLNWGMIGLKLCQIVINLLDVREFFAPPIQFQAQRISNPQEIISGPTSFSPCFV